MTPYFVLTKVLFFFEGLAGDDDALDFAGVEKGERGQVSHISHFLTIDHQYPMIL
jgi:hypothetical protein